MAWWLLLLGVGWGAVQDWENRAIYSVLVDRFARGDGDDSACTSLKDYCGGTFKGIEQQLDYIVGLGVDVLLLSDVLAQDGETLKFFETRDFYEVNQNYGTAEDLKSLVRACHRWGLLVSSMVNLNNIGTVQDSNYSSIVPFDKAEYYHPYCTINYNDKKSVEWCWFNKLPDLDQENPFVRRTFIGWVSWYKNEFGFDGVHFARGRFVPYSFWTELNTATSMFTSGTMPGADLATIGAYQGPFDGLFDHELYSIINSVFGRGFDFKYITTVSQQINSLIVKPSLMLNFISGQDYSRFLGLNSNEAAYHNAVAFIMMFPGIPVLYYGDEQNFKGKDFPENSPPLWDYLNTDSPSYIWFSRLLQFRKSHEVWKHDWVQRTIGRNYLVASRGRNLIVFAHPGATETVQVDAASFFETQSFCNVLSSGDCITVRGNVLSIKLSGEVKLYEPKE